MRLHQQSQKFMNRLTCFIVAIIMPFLSAGQLYYPPATGSTWDTISPTRMGYCQDSIDALYDFLGKNNTKAFILLKDGKIVLEKYFGNFTVDSNWYWASAGKTLTAGLVGIAQHNNILSLSDTTSKYLGKGWTSCTPAQEDKITIRHQLAMTTGLDDGVANSGCMQPSCLQYKADAGTRWAYHNAPYTLLDSVLQFASGKNINLLVTQWIKNPTGMNGIYLPQGDAKVYFSTARSMARYGLLLLSKGVWDGTAVIADTAYLNNMVNSSQNLNLSYGYLTWLNGKSSFMIPQTQVTFPGPLNADAPADMYAALGKDAQLLNIVPSQNMVWVRMGEAPPGSNGPVAPAFNNEVWQRLNRLKCPQTIVKPSNIHDLDIYPNPANDIVHIHAGAEIERIVVWNSIGKKEWVSYPDTRQTTYSPGNLATGIYIIEVRLKTGEHILKKLARQ